MKYVKIDLLKIFEELLAYSVPCVRNDICPCIFPGAINNSRGNNAIFIIADGINCVIALLVIALLPRFNHGHEF